MTLFVREGPIAHFILMRFNVRTKHAAEPRDAAIRSRQNWLQTRFLLFEQFCWPTIAAQSSKNFELHVYFDSGTSQDDLKRFEAITGNSSFTKMITCDYFDTDLVIAHIRQRIDTHEAEILTTRLDNDDGLNCDFVTRVQSEVRLGTREAINFPTGLVVHAGAAYRSRQQSNAFISVVESCADFKTVLQASHNQVEKLFPIRNVETDAMWLQHVHGGNVSNKVRGERLLRSALPRGFESVDLADRIKPVSRTAVAFENTTAGPWRASRDLAARAARAIGLR